jgi:hypothetical protein
MLLAAVLVLGGGCEGMKNDLLAFYSLVFSSGYLPFVAGNPNNILMFHGATLEWWEALYTDYILPVLYIRISSQLVILWIVLTADDPLNSSHSW